MGMIRKAHPIALHVLIGGTKYQIEINEFELVHTMRGIIRVHITL